MNTLRLAVLSIVIWGCCIHPMNAQRLIFSGDTAIIVSCEKIPLPNDDLEVFNNTDEDIFLQWERTYFSFPDNSSMIMVITGLQYFHYVSYGHVNLKARDSTNIIFYFYLDTITPGDSVIVQIKMYDPADSINTAKLQTIIQYCPLVTNAGEIKPPASLRVFPNPMADAATIILPEIQETTSVAIFNITGKQVRLIPMSNSQMTFAREGLPGGIYFAGLIQHGHVTRMTKFVLLD